MMRPNNAATEAGPEDSDDMSIEIAAELREESSKARKVSERLSNPDDREVLALLAPTHGDCRKAGTRR